MKGTGRDWLPGPVNHSPLLSTGTLPGGAVRPQRAPAVVMVIVVTNSV